MDLDYRGPGRGRLPAVPQSTGMALPAADPDDLVPALRAVDDALGSFTLTHSGGEGRRREVQALLRGYLLPRLQDRDGTLVVAVVGGSGSGKSTLLNSLAGRRISPSGPLRPTTTTPVVWSAGGLPSILDGRAGRTVVSDPAPPAGLALVDTPPPSVVDEAGRPVAAAVLEVADACCFVASGIRYADAAGWSLIRLAARRDLPSLFVLNRLSGAPEICRLLEADFTRRLVAAGLLSARGGEGVLGVGEGPIDRESGALPPDSVAGIRERLVAWADPLARRELVDRVAAASLSGLARGLADLRAGLVDEAVACLALADAVGAGYEPAAADLADDLQAGRLAPLADGPPGDLAVVAVRRCSRAARAVASAWEADPAGRRLLGGRVELWAHGPRTAEAAGTLVEEWARTLPSRAAAACGRTRVRRGRARREAEALRRISLDPAHRPVPGKVRRPAALVAAAGEARRDLGEALGRVLEEDASRFRALVGLPPPGALLTRLRLDGEAP